MLNARGIVEGNRVLVIDEEISQYDGKQVDITILECPAKPEFFSILENETLVTSTARGRHVSEYMKEMCKNDRTSILEADVMSFPSHGTR